MFRSDESKGTFRLENNTVYKLQSIKFSSISTWTWPKSGLTYLPCLHKSTTEIQKKSQLSSNKTLLLNIFQRFWRGIPKFACTFFSVCSTAFVFTIQRFPYWIGWGESPYKSNIFSFPPPRKSPHQVFIPLPH